MSIRGTIVESAGFLLYLENGRSLRSMSLDVVKKNVLKIVFETFCFPKRVVLGVETKIKVGDVAKVGKISNFLL